jgi:hypothetical protein
VRKRTGPLVSSTDVQNEKTDVVYEALKHIAKYSRTRIACLWGPSGWGKTYRVNKLANELGARVWRLTLKNIDPTEIVGFDVEIGGELVHSPPSWLREMIEHAEAGGRCVLFLDEFGAAPPRVRSAVYILLRERLVGNVPLPQDTVVVAATNPYSPDGGELTRMIYLPLMPDREYLTEAAGDHTIALYLARVASVDGVPSDAPPESQRTSPPPPVDVTPADIEAIRQLLVPAFWTLSRGAQNLIIKSVVRPREAEAVLRQVRRERPYVWEEIIRRPGLLYLRLQKATLPEAVNIIHQCLRLLPTIEIEAAAKFLRELIRIYICDNELAVTVFNVNAPDDVVESVTSVPPQVVYENIRPYLDGVLIDDGAGGHTATLVGPFVELDARIEKGWLPRWVRNARAYRENALEKAKREKSEDPVPAGVCTSP